MPKSEAELSELKESRKQLLMAVCEKIGGKWINDSCVVGNLEFIPEEKKYAVYPDESIVKRLKSLTGAMKKSMELGERGVVVRKKTEYLVLDDDAVLDYIEERVPIWHKGININRMVGSWWKR